MNDVPPQNSKEARWWGLIAFLSLTLAVGAIGSFATHPGESNWFIGLKKPSFNPPGWLFAPVWTALYAMMAIAAWRVWRIAKLASRAILLFFAQLALNFAWSFIFFRAHNVELALVEIVALLIFITLTTLAFWRIDKVAGLLLVPYLCWVSFATLLNLSILLLNS